MKSEKDSDALTTFAIYDNAAEKLHLFAFLLVFLKNLPAKELVIVTNQLSFISANLNLS